MTCYCGRAEDLDFLSSVRSCLCHSLSVEPWGSHVTAMRVCFLFYKVGLSAVFVSEPCCEDLMTLTDQHKDLL